jgi:integrase/recombinase XerD
MQAAENPASFGTQNTKAKLIKRIARLVRQDGLDYQAWRYVSKKVRQLCQLRPRKASRKLPRVLTEDEFRRFYAQVDKAGNGSRLSVG